MKKFFYIIITLLIFNSCSEYQKVLKAEEIAPKFKMGEDLYNEGKFAKANRLFAQIVPSYRGKPQAQKLMFLYCKSFYELREYYNAGYQFERFVASYPKSEKVAEAAFLSVKSYYMLSPPYTKDQTETKEAIDKIQEFINLYPESEYVEEANKLFKELEFKLEEKAYSIARQYNHLSDYPASIKSFDNFVFDFPGSSLRENAFFYRLDSAYRLAMNSIEYRNKVGGGIEHIKLIRLKDAKEYYIAFKKAYSDSEHVQVADNMATALDEELKKYSNKS